MNQNKPPEDEMCVKRYDGEPCGLPHNSSIHVGPYEPGQFPPRHDFSRGMRVIVTGGRNYDVRDHVYRVLDHLATMFGIARIVTGGGTGADQIALDWASDRCIPRTRYMAKWDEYGKSAGPRRNAEMIEKGADLCVAFSGGKGTADTIRRAAQAGIEVFRA